MALAPALAVCRHFGGEHDVFRDQAPGNARVPLTTEGPGGQLGGSLAEAKPQIQGQGGWEPEDEAVRR